MSLDVAPHAFSQHSGAGILVVIAMTRLDIQRRHAAIDAVVLAD
jgi:hypothetical protein